VKVNIGHNMPQFQAALRQQIPKGRTAVREALNRTLDQAAVEEMSRLPRKTRAEQDAALEELNCVHLGPNGCTVYEERPLICRLCGTTKTLPCPNGRGPVELIHQRAEAQVFEYMAANRQVLV